MQRIYVCHIRIINVCNMHVTITHAYNMLILYMCKILNRKEQENKSRALARHVACKTHITCFIDNQYISNNTYLVK